MIKLPKFISVSVCSMPDPRWRPEHAKKGAPKPIHPCIPVMALLGDDQTVWLWDEVFGFRPVSEPQARK